MERKVIDLSHYFSLFLWLSTYLPTYLSIYLSLSLSLCVCLSIYLSICLSIYLFIYLSISLSLSRYLPIYLSIHPFIHPSIHPTPSIHPSDSIHLPCTDTSLVFLNWNFNNSYHVNTTDYKHMTKSSTSLWRVSLTVSPQCVFFQAATGKIFEITGPQRIPSADVPSCGQKRHTRWPATNASACNECRMRFSTREFCQITNASACELAPAWTSKQQSDVINSQVLESLRVCG